MFYRSCQNLNDIHIYSIFSIYNVGMLNKITFNTYFMICILNYFKWNDNHFQHQSNNIICYTDGLVMNTSTHGRTRCLSGNLIHAFYR